MCLPRPADADGAAVPSQLLRVSQSTAQLQQGLLKSGVCNCLLRVGTPPPAAAPNPAPSFDLQPPHTRLLPLLLVLLLCVLLPLCRTAV